VQKEHDTRILLILCILSKKAVLDRIYRIDRIFKPGGGFVFAAIHNILAYVAPENIVAMFDTAYEPGHYH